MGMLKGGLGFALTAGGGRANNIIPAVRANGLSPEQTEGDGPIYFVGAAAARGTRVDAATATHTTTSRANREAAPRSRIDNISRADLVLAFRAF